jgi:hypothetical protein
MEKVYLILSWDISDTMIKGPYESADIAQAALVEDREGGNSEFLEQALVLGPLPVA